MQRYTEIPYTAIFRWRFGTRYDDSTFTVSVLFKFHKNISFAASSKRLSWIIIDSLGHLHVCQWVVRTILKVKITKQKTYMHVLGNKCLQVLNESLAILMLQSLSFNLSKQCTVIRTVPWMIYHGSIIRIVPWRCVSLHLYWSAGNAQSSAAPDPAFAFVGGLCCPIHSNL